MKSIFLLPFFLLGQLLYAQDGPGGVGSSNGTSALKLWLSAGKGVYKDAAKKQQASEQDRIMYWEDLSGSGNGVWAPSDSARPAFLASAAFVNHQAAVRFSRNNARTNKRNHLISSSFPKTDDITIYCVFHPLSKGGGNNVTPFTGTLPNDSSWYYGAGLVDADVIDPKNDISMTLCDTSLAAGGGDSIAKLEFSVKTPLEFGKSYVACLQKEAATRLLQISQNGAVPATFTGGSQPLNSPLRYTIGASSNTTYGNDNTFFDGYMSAVAVFNKKLSEAEKVILDNYFSATYNTLLLQHDIFRMDDALQGNYDYQMAGIGQGKDGIPLLHARGEGIVEMKADKLENESYLLWAHNNEALQFQASDVPEGVRQRLIRTWGVNQAGITGLVDVLLDASTLVLDPKDELVLLVDMDNNGMFEDQHPGNGMYARPESQKNSLVLFKNVELKNVRKFTFAVLKPACLSDCDDAFSPNGDGVSDTYHISGSGNAIIYNKSGERIRELKTPCFWDGTGADSSPLEPGLYFIVSNEARQKTITLIR